MNYEDIIADLKTMNAAITGVEDALDYEPAVPKITPIIYTLLNRHLPELVTPTAQRHQYEIFLRLLLSWTDEQTCEQNLNKFVDRIKAKYAPGNTLDAKLDGGWCRLSGGDAKYILIGKVVYRRLEYIVEVVSVE